MVDINIVKMVCEPPKVGLLSNFGRFYVKIHDVSPTQCEMSPNWSSWKKTTILMADDHPLFRKAVHDVLEKQEDFKIIAEANNGIEAIDLSAQMNPDVVIMDISMPQINGLEATRRIKSKNPKIAVLVLTVHNDIEHILGILEAGAAGYLTKSASVEEIVNAIRSVVAGETVIATPVFQEVLKYTLKYPQKPLISEETNKLTIRELEVLKLAAKGFSNKEISQKLNLKLSTVKGYMVEIFLKMGVSSRTEAVIIGLRTGVITSLDIETIE
jgi:DNA-binding NarL/FixJ family response regulator